MPLQGAGCHWQTISRAIPLRFSSERRIAPRHSWREPCRRSRAPVSRVAPGPVEWVAMVGRQPRHQLSVRSRDRQRHETLRLELIDEPVRHRQIPKRTFDPQLPGRHRRDEGLVSVLNEFTTPRTHCGAVIEPPQGNMTIQKDPHNASASDDASKIATMSASEPTTSSPYRTRPDHDPGTRAELAAFQATILATGRPLRATITSAPSSASRISSDRRDFASCVLTTCVVIVLA